MHMAVMAEGVETEAQRSILNIIGCDQLQGYLLSRPVEPPNWTRFCVNRNLQSARVPEVFSDNHLGR